MLYFIGMGLKKAVVPRAGTWIETETIGISEDGNVVVPRAGTWIETYV